MAATIINTGDAISQKVWRPGLIHEVERQTIGMNWVAKGDQNAFMLLDDLTKKRGDIVQIRFSPTDDSDGLSEGDQITGNGQKVRFFNDELKISWLGESWELESPMSQQRVNFDLKQTVFNKASIWWRRRWDESIWNQMCGFTPSNTAGFKRTGLNPVVEYTSTHRIFSDPSGLGPYITDEAVAADTTAIITLDDINTALLRMQSKSFLTYPIAPAQDGFYHIVISPVGWKQLRDSSTAGDWEDIQLSQVKGGVDYTSTGLARGFMGIYNNVKIHVSDYITNGVNSISGLSEPNTRRAVIFGQKAASMAFGEGYAQDGHLDWHEEVFDHKRWSLLVDSVYGFKRVAFDTTTAYGSIVITHFSEFA